MKSAGYLVLLGAVAVGLSGCGNAMRNYLEKETPAQQLSVRQDLTMPPDLRLPPPGTTAPAPDPGAAAAAVPPAARQAALTPPATPVKTPAKSGKSAPAAPATTAAATPATPPASGVDSVYTNAGISLTNPDGSRKSDQQLREELRAYYIAQKKAKNPSYGTVFNVGNIFKDE